MRQPCHEVDAIDVMSRTAKESLIGAPGEIRTPDQLVRSQLLYPAELRARVGGGLYRFLVLAEGHLSI
jgi:hypothetical protein